jgi:hypothetical protein
MLTQRISHDQCKELAISIFGAYKIQENSYRKLIAHQWNI